MWFCRKKPRLLDMKETLPRAEVLRRGRIAILDDEMPEMLKDLRDQGLNIAHLQTTEDAQGRLDYTDKKLKYFANRINTRPNSLRVLQNTQWTPTELECNHQAAIAEERVLRW